MSTPSLRRLQQGTGTVGPARIKVMYQGLSQAGLTNAEARVVEEFAVPRAIEQLSGAIRVKQEQSPLQVSRVCTTIWTDTGGKCSEEPIAPVCGFPSIGIVASIPTSIVGPAVYYPSGPNGSPVTVPEGGPGLERTDFIVFATAASSSSSVCGSDTQAFATVCQRDDTGRPVMGIIVFCKPFLEPSGRALEALEAASASQSAELAAMLEFQLGRMVSLSVHEIMHALGFSSDSWPLFVSAETGSPLTPRDGNNNPTTSRQVQCSSGTFDMFYADSSTVAFTAERGAQQCDPATLTQTRDCVSRVVLPHSRSAAREFFGCSDLSGVELENQPTTDCVLSGSHLEQRVFSGTIMTPFTTQASLLDAASLAIMHDSGWWLPNYFAGGNFKPGLDFATHAGCGLARDSYCLNAGNPPTQGATSITRSAGGSYQGALTPDRFCTEAKDAVCTPDLRAVGFCQVNTYTSALPARFRYFSANPAQGGEIQPDFCPQAAFYTNRICTDPSSNWKGGSISAGESDTRNVFGNIFGTGSMCVATQSLIKDGWTSTSPPAAGCFKVACENKASGVVRVSADSLQGGAVTSVTCNSKGTSVSVPGYSGTLLCPDPEVVCKDAAPVVPQEPGMVGVGSSLVQVPWTKEGSSSPSATVTTQLELARALFSTAGSPASALPAVDVVVTLRAATTAEVALAGLPGAVPGQPVLDLGFAQQFNATDSTASVQVSWQAGETGRKAASPAWLFPAWPVDINNPNAKPAARVLIATVTAATSASEAAISSDVNTAVVVLTTSAPTAIVPETTNAAAAKTPAMLGLLLLLVAALQAAV